MKLDTLGDDMVFKILALKEFNLGRFTKPAIVGEIEGITPNLEFNNGMEYLGPEMFSCDDYMLAELGTCKQFRTYLNALEKINDILQDCPFIEMYKTTNTFIGSYIIECKIWWETNIDLIFNPQLIKDFFSSELEQLHFQAMHLKLLELFRFCSSCGLIQLATNKEIDQF